MHPVAAALRSRPDGARIALVIEGGGMRGAVSGGMTLGLHELGLHRAFDAAYGSSAGALNAMWTVADRLEVGTPPWYDPSLAETLIQPKRALRRQPVVDVRTLVGQRYEEQSPGVFQAVLDSPMELHPIATIVGTGRPLDLHPFIRDVESLKLALMASSSLPLLAGGPVALDGLQLLDAGLSAAIPFRAAIDDGATHILVLRSRREGEVATAPSRASGLLTSRLLGRISPAVATAFMTRAVREGEDEKFLDRHDRGELSEPAILSIRPAPDSPVPSRLEKDTSITRAGFEAGRAAVHAALS